MDSQELKKFDKRISEIEYPFGKNYPTFFKIFADAAKQENISVTEVIRQYVGWKYSRR